MADPRRVAVIQARLGSTRLPRKVLAEVAGEPMLLRIAGRLRRSRRLADVAVSTSTEAMDDSLVDVCRRSDLAVVRGEVDDIIGRLAATARSTGADVLVRVWGDCPFVDGSVVDDALDRFDDDELDFLTNSPPQGRTYPAGLDIELYRTTLLDRLDVEVTDPQAREFPARTVLADDGARSGVLHLPRDLSQLHLTVDYPEDLEAARRIAGLLLERGDPVGLDALLAAVEAAGASFADAPRNVEYRAYLQAGEREVST